MDKILLEFNDATIGNGNSSVIFNFNMTVSEGDFVYIVGKVGSGKTSIIRTIIAENSLHSGSGHVCGFDLSAMKEKNIPQLRRKIGIIFQDFQLLMDRTVHDNLEFVLRSTGWKDESEVEKRIAKVLNDVGMSTKSHKMPYHLSGGEQQRIAIARALLNDPVLILADEPTGNLDTETANGIMELLCRINRDSRTAIVMVTHNNSLVEAYPGRIFICNHEECQEKLQ